MMLLLYVHVLYIQYNTPTSNICLPSSMMQFKDILGDHTFGDGNFFFTTYVCIVCTYIYVRTQNSYDSR